MPFLLHIDFGEGSNVLRRFEGNLLRIGRGTNTDLRLEDSRVDLEHAEILQDGRSFTLVDRDSVTGTYVNGRPVRGFRLDEGDVIEIGGFRLAVGLMELAGEEAPRLMLEVSPLSPSGHADPETRSRTRTKTVALPKDPPPAAIRGRSQAKAEPVDYAAAYRLGRGRVSKAVLSLGALAVTILTGAWLIQGGRTEAFRPGPVSEAHAAVIGTSSCGECHAPFAGASDRSCTECHRDHPIHQPAQASTPRCGSCHFEHRGPERLTRVRDAACVSCHGDLEVRPGAVLSVTGSITSFGRRHPDFAAPEIDPNPLRLNHARHLKPLDTPEGPVTLECSDCHESAQGENGIEGRMRPVELERHCQSCHLLTFDPGLPDQEVPHESPALVAAYVLREYAGGDEWRELSFEERRRLIATNPRPSYRIGQGERQAAAEAESYLFQSVCPQCHLLDRSGSIPEVEPVTASRDWLPAARFPHDKHGESVRLKCADCHPAEESSATADVLIPGIGVCRNCHGEGADDPAELTRAGALQQAPSECADCHGYHLDPEPRNAALAQTPLKERP